METFCGIVVVGIVVYIVLQIMMAAIKASDEKAERIKSQKILLDGQRKTLQNKEDAIISTVKDFFARKYTDALDYESDYERTYNELNNSIGSMQTTIAVMKEINGKLVKESRKEDQSATIAQEESRAITQARHIAEGLREFGQEVYTLPSSKMMDEGTYGKINKRYWDGVIGLKRTSVVAYIEQCENLLNSTNFDDIFSIDLEEVLKCVWFFATEKTFAALDFQKAEKVFSRIYKRSYADVTIADLYAKKKMGGEDVLRDPVRALLKSEEDSKKLTLIASGLMWMNAYQSESTVLQSMLTTGKEMTVKTQERLHSLTNGGGKAPSGFSVRSSGNMLYFDVSALAWKDDEYKGLFENLAFQDKKLTYSLAVRDENKDLVISQRVNVPGVQEILRKFKATFDREYGSNVTVQEAECIALSGSGEEKMEGILVSSNECKQMGIVIYIARIGRKLTIKFYTLFMPTAMDLATQKQEALSLYNKLSPSVTMWESSLKDTMLMALEQMLNDSSTESRMDSDKPVF